MKITCGIYLYSTEKKKFLLCHATKSSFKNWSIPKGLPDEGEAELNAAIRELLEETGIDLKELHVLAVKGLPEVPYQKQKKTLKPFLVVTDTRIDESRLKCSTLVDGKYPEVDKFKWADLEEMKELAHETQTKNLELIEEELRKLKF